MSDFDKILMTAAVTVFGGLIFHFFTQFFLKLFIEPVQKYRDHKSEAISLLHFYSNILGLRVEKCEPQVERERYFKAQDEIRMCYSNLTAAYHSIFPKWLAMVLCLIPKKDKFKMASGNLLSLSFLGNFKAENQDSIELAKKRLVCWGQNGKTKIFQLH